MNHRALRVTEGGKRSIGEGGAPISYSDFVKRREGGILTLYITPEKIRREEKFSKKKRSLVLLRQPGRERR